METILWTIFLAAIVVSFIVFRIREVRASAEHAQRMYEAGKAMGHAEALHERVVQLTENTEA